MTYEELLEMLKAGAVTAGEFTVRAANCAGKKASEVYNTSKHQFFIFDLKNDISDLYKEIGALVYDTHRKGTDNTEKIGKRIEQIEKKEAEIYKLRELIDELRNEKTCNECGTRSEKSAEFCKKCGNKI